MPLTARGAGHTSYMTFLTTFIHVRLTVFCLPRRDSVFSKMEDDILANFSMFSSLLHHSGGNKRRKGRPHEAPKNGLYTCVAGRRGLKTIHARNCEIKKERETCRRCVFLRRCSEATRGNISGRGESSRLPAHRRPRDVI